jgi:hypothetical protein
MPTDLILSPPIAGRRPTAERQALAAVLLRV